MYLLFIISLLTMAGVVTERFKNIRISEVKISQVLLKENNFKNAFDLFTNALIIALYRPAGHMCETSCRPVTANFQIIIIIMVRARILMTCHLSFLAR